MSRVAFRVAFLVVPSIWGISGVGVHFLGVLIVRIRNFLGVLVVRIRYFLGVLVVGWRQFFVVLVIRLVWFVATFVVGLIRFLVILIIGLKRSLVVLAAFLVILAALLTKKTISAHVDISVTGASRHLTEFWTLTFAQEAPLTGLSLARVAHSITRARAGPWRRFWCHWRRYVASLAKGALLADFKISTAGVARQIAKIWTRVLAQWTAFAS